MYSENSDVLELNIFPTVFFSYSYIIFVLRISRIRNRLLFYVPFFLSLFDLDSFFSFLPLSLLVGYGEERLIVLTALFDFAGRCDFFLIRGSGFLIEKFPVVDVVRKPEHDTIVIYWVESLEN